MRPLVSELPAPPLPTPTPQPQSIAFLRNDRAAKRLPGKVTGVYLLPSLAQWRSEAISSALIASVTPGAKDMGLAS